MSQDIKLSKSPSVIEWVKKIWYAYMNNELLFSYKKELIFTSAAKWNKLKTIMLSEITQTQKDKYCMFSPK